MPDKPIPTSLKEFLNSISNASWRPRLPYVPPPTMFQPDPPVQGPTGVARMVKMILDQMPAAKAQISSVHTGPTSGVMDRLNGSNFSPSAFDRTTLLGRYDFGDKKVFLRPPTVGEDPSLSIPSMFNTMVHEASHASGHNEASADELGNKAEKLASPELFQQILSRWHK